MAREVFKLSALKVRRITAQGKYGDGGGLYLSISNTGNRSWIYRWRDRVTGKLRDHGLGPCWDVSLEQARAKAKICREQVRSGGDPIEDKRAAITAKRIELTKRLTFAECSAQFIEVHRSGWRNPKHAEQWVSTLKTYAEPINPLPVSDVDTALVLKCLEPYWSTKTETMTRVRQRIENVLDWATVREYRSGENPARWKGHLDKILPKRSKVAAVKHHPALPYADMYEFMRKLHQHEGLSACCLELQILTATRPGEAAGARWDEIDLDAATWTIPADRMKAGIEHRIPLSPAAVAMLRRMPRRHAHVFPGIAGKPITIAAGLKLAKTLHPGIVPHGFRSTFRDWAGETTAHPREVIEHAMAHRLKDKAEAAYQRGDLFQRRVRLMDDWATYCDTAPRKDNVTAIKRKRA